MAINVKPLGPVLGARVEGIDLSKPLAAEDKAAIHDAFTRYLVLSFPGQKLEPADQIRFSQLFGELDRHILTQYNHPQFPDIFVLSNEEKDGKPIGLADAGSYWHSDFAFKEYPAKATMLYALAIPPDGGDTLFINMCAAYEALSPEMKRRLDGLQAIHRYRPNAKDRSRGTTVRLTTEQEKATPDIVHPLVRRHIESGRKALFIQPSTTVGIVGMDPAAADSLLESLFEHCLKPEFRFTYSWTVGDALIWDNRTTMHSATTRHLPKEMRRTLHRTTIRGERPV